MSLLSAMQSLYSDWPVGFKFCLEKYYFANEGPSGQGYGFSSGHVWT